MRHGKYLCHKIANLVSQQQNYERGYTVSKILIYYRKIMSEGWDYEEKEITTLISGRLYHIGSHLVHMNGSHRVVF